MLLLQLGWALAILLMIGGYLFYKKQRGDAAVKHRWLFVLGALLLGFAVDCLDRYYIRQDVGFGKSHSYLYIVAICFSLYLPVLLLPLRFRKYPLAVYVAALLSFFVYGVYGNVQTYLDISTQPKCSPQPFADMTGDAVPTEMERVFNMNRSTRCVK